MLRYAKFLQLLVILLLIRFVQAQPSTEGLLSLRDCIHIALEHNSTLKTNEYADQAAKMDVLSSYKGILPSLSVSAGRSNVETGPSEYLSNEPVGIDADGNVMYQLRTRKTEKSLRKSTTAGLTVDQTLFDGGIWWNQIRKAHADKEASDLNLASQRDKVIMQVQQAYFDLLKQINLLEVDSLAVQRSKEQLDRAKKMYELGATAQLDVFRAKVNMGNDRISYMQQKNKVEQSKKNLNLVMGRDPFKPIRVQVDVKLDKSLPDVEAMINTAYQNQPLLKKNEFQIKANELSVSMAKGINYPRISAYVNYNRFNEDAARVFSNYGQNYQTQYGLRLSFNLFNGFSDYATIQKAEISKRSAQEGLAEYKRNLKSMIHQYYQDYKSYLNIIEINQDNLQAAKEEYRLARERYQIGAGTALDVRESQVNLTRAEETLIAAKFNARIVLAQLDNQLGLSYKKFQKTE